MQKCLLLFLALSACLVIVSAKPKPAAAPKKGLVGKKGTKISCTSCVAAGDECTSATKASNCDKCVKFTGISDDPSQVPPSAWKLMPAGSKDTVTKNKGKKVTFRGCAPQEWIDVVELGGGFTEYGCMDLDEFYGFKDAYGCLCQGDCKD